MHSMDIMTGEMEGGGGGGKGRGGCKASLSILKMLYIFKIY